jgi:hypothetical protein
LTSRACGPKATLSKRGYFSKAGIRYGRQLGRVIATHYEEIVVVISLPVMSNSIERCGN